MAGGTLWYLLERKARKQKGTCDEFHPNGDLPITSGLGRAFE